MGESVYFYIHIPYCYKKCPYCSFVSYEKKLSTVSDYFKALQNEISSFETDKTVETIYFGGGTPSLVNVEQIDKIINLIYKKFKVIKLPEITIETNPVDAKYKFLKSIKSIGINRISLGVQSFIDRKLRTLGRIHNAKISSESIKNALNVGFDNISVDLIYGLKETPSEIEYEINSANQFDIRHISTYMLSVEKKTAFYEMVKNGKIEISKEDEVADAYIYIAELLKNRGFEHYEISNFAKKDFESRHNNAYWLGYDYRGFGVSASSFVNGERFSNTDAIEDYIKLIKNKKSTIKHRENLSNLKSMKESFVLLMRLAKGVDINLFNKKYKTDVERVYKDELEHFIKLGFIKKENGKISLNGEQSMVVSNSILSDFV